MRIMVLLLAFHADDEIHAAYTYFGECSFVANTNLLKNDVSVKI